MGARTRRIFSLGVTEWRHLLRAQWALLVAQLVVRRRPPGQLTSRTETAAAAPAASDSRAAHKHAHLLGDAVRRAARYGVFRPACLVRAIALRQLLATDGIRGAVIRVGVKQSEEGMLAHAWVELDGDVIGDTPEHVRQYAPLNELSVAP
ncbi:MAG TPA: lasso peptide biosynthesis B2 protein [Gemmatimonadaceae bacterium]|nr:lasso peptide biosynthesis B2 protein [Gemmatimonadaceae bacterium]